MFSHASRGERARHSSAQDMPASRGASSDSAKLGTLRRALDNSGRVASLMQLGRTLNHPGRTLQAKAKFADKNSGEAMLVGTWRKLVPFIAQQGLAPLRYSEYRRARLAMEASSIDYGEINVDDANHLMQLYHNLRNQLSRGHHDSEDGYGTEPIVGQEARARHHSAMGDIRNDVFNRRGLTSFKVVFVGEGASVAYAISAMGSGFDPSTAAVIGPRSQPWSAQRGPGVVAHPSHQITPKRRYAGRTEVTDRWQDRGSFSNDISSVIRGVRHIDGAVTAIERRYGTYKITVGGQQRPIFADKLVVGAGAGAHKVPEGTNPAAVATRGGDVGIDRRIMSMDVFTQVAGDLWKDNTGRLRNSLLGRDKKKHNITVVLSGANGGIDVAYDALRRGYSVEFIVSSGASFLTGFPNYAAYLPYIRGALKSLNAARGILEARARLVRTQNQRADNAKKLAEVHKKIGEVEKAAAKAGFAPQNSNYSAVYKLYRNQEPAVSRGFTRAHFSRFEGVYFGRAGAPQQTDQGVSVNVADPFTGEREVVGDIFVYAIGQEADVARNPIFAILETLKAQLVPLMDIDKRFSDEGEAVLGLGTADRSLQVVGASAFRYAPNVDLHANQDRNEKSALASMEFFAKRLNAERRSIGFTGNNVLWRKAFYIEFAYRRYVTEVRNADARQKALQKTAFEFALKDFTAYVTASRANSQLIPALKLPAIDQYLKTANRAALTLGANAGATMGAQGPAVASLPANVLINDQLTPSRSQIEATHGFVPLDIGSFANFTSDDRTALAIHISAKYPSLADYRQGKFVEAIAAMIIKNRKSDRVAALVIPGGNHAGPLFTFEASTRMPVPPTGAEFQAHWARQLQEANQAVKGQQVV